MSSPRWIIVSLLVISCSPSPKSNLQDNTAWILPKAPGEIEQKIKLEFPGAMMLPVFADSMIGYVDRKYGIKPATMLLGTSTCVDDIIYTKDFHAHPEIKGPFHLGGLGGLPFTGITGLEAFAHHIPDDGAMILLIEPHIGISVQKGWGSVLRHGQQDASSCCGALIGALQKAVNDELKGTISEEDYQEDRIKALAFRHEDEIVKSPNPILALTRLTSVEAEEQIMRYLAEMSLTHISYVFVITGVLINTDYQYSDYQYVDHFMVYDVRKKAFVEDMTKPFSGPN